MASEQQRIEAFSEAVQLLANEGAENLHPGHVGNILLLAAISIGVQLGGVEATRAGLLLAADNLGMGNG